ncbi:MAG: hypothetical protein DME01_22250, partial [Candidatus Rokuibacteriota bacterium]
GNSGCDGSEEVAGQLVGYNDWANLEFNFRASPEFADGVHSSTDTKDAEDPTPDQVAAMFVAADRNADGVGDALGCGGAACVLAIPQILPLVQVGGEKVVFVPFALITSTVFDATQVLKSSITLSGAPVLQQNGRFLCAAIDVNRDTLKDEVCTAKVTGLGPGNHTFVLEAEDALGRPIRAKAAARVVVPGGGDDD